MLATLFPKGSRRYLSLPLFGPVLDSFADWLLEQGYIRSSRRYALRIVVRMDRYLRRQGIQHIQELTPSTFHRCWKALHRRVPAAAGTARVMERFLRLRGLLQSAPNQVSSATGLHLEAYSVSARGPGIFPIHPSQSSSYCGPVSGLSGVRENPTGTGSCRWQPS